MQAQAVSRVRIQAPLAPCPFVFEPQPGLPPPTQGKRYSLIYCAEPDIVELVKKEIQVYKDWRVVALNYNRLL